MGYHAHVRRGIEEQSLRRTGLLRNRIALLSRWRQVRARFDQVSFLPCAALPRRAYCHVFGLSNNLRKPHFFKSQVFSKNLLNRFIHLPRISKPPVHPPPRLKTTKRRPLRTVAAPDRQTSPSGWCRANLDGATPCSGYLPAACSPVCAWPVDEVRNARPGALRFWRIGVLGRALRSNSFRPRRRFTARRLAGRLT